MQVSGRTPNLARAVQGTLFQERPVFNVIPFDSFAPSPSAPPRPHPKTATGPKPASKAPPRRTSRAPEGQGTLDLLLPAPVKPRTLGTSVEAVICCDAPVAIPLHRALAAAIDWVMVLIGYGLFLAAFWLGGGAFALNKPSLLVFGGMLLLIAFTYGLLFTIAGTETFGMRSTRLRVLTFDGFPPDGKQRLVRFAGSCLGLCTLLGLLWCLADEESLTWADHISGTFPTPHEFDSQVFRRR
ncbi:MAG: RDD family protein [Bryobacteraceae bacterium]